VRTSLIVTTFDRPDALACVFASLRSQSSFPEEMIVADDGSGAETRGLVERFRSEVPFPVVHAWQAHEGFRVCRARNLAIARARGDYIVQIDGDMVLHPQFIADHRAAARAACFVQGTRILLDEVRTNELLAQGLRPLRPWSPGLGGLRRLYACYLPSLSPGLRTVANAFIAIKSCNQAFWRSDLLRVNGYNEAMTGWGCGDKELAARLTQAGVRRKTLLFAGIAYHLHHAPASRENLEFNRQILARTRAEAHLRCVAGLDRHL
jgi:glycosyltransferase involved in cell wall biosynthesis